MRSIELFGKEVVPRVRNRRIAGGTEGNDIG
jgi:hypothetical protein